MSNLGARAAYFLIARQMSKGSQLRAWLMDMSDKPAPFLDFDLRGLTVEARREFWNAVERAYTFNLSFPKPELLRESPGQSFIENLRAARQAMNRGDPPPSVTPWDGSPIDFDETWRSGLELDAWIEAQETQYVAYLASLQSQV